MLAREKRRRSVGRAARVQARQGERRMVSSTRHRAQSAAKRRPRFADCLAVRRRGIWLGRFGKRSRRLLADLRHAELVGVRHRQVQSSPRYRSSALGARGQLLQGQLRLLYPQRNLGVPVPGASRARHALCLPRRLRGPRRRGRLRRAVFCRSRIRSVCRARFRRAHRRRLVVYPG